MLLCRDVEGLSDGAEGVGQVSRVGKRRNGRLLRAATQEKQMTRNRSHITGLSVVAEEATTIATPVPPSVPAPPEALLKLT